MAFLVNLDQAMQAYSVPCWWVGWWLWRVGCISQDTYLLYCIFFGSRSGIYVLEMTFRRCNLFLFQECRKEFVDSSSLRRHQVASTNFQQHEYEQKSTTTTTTATLNYNNMIMIMSLRCPGHPQWREKFQVWKMWKSFHR